jgi:hypothetical protein
VKAVAVFENNGGKDDDEKRGHREGRLERC